jgi:carbon storage regulator CsrA
MLILRRRCGQSITIGDNAEIIIKVLQNEAGVVSIGVDAPPSVKVHRIEKYEKWLLASSSSEHHRSTLLNRLKLFEKRIKNIHPANDSLNPQDFSSS